MSNIVKLKKFLETIKKYDNYFYKHGGDVLLTLLSFILIFAVFTYVSFKKKAYYYRKNWSKYRCNPGITPFAGFINAPENSNFSEKIDYTVKNFSKCTQEVMQTNIGEMTAPLKKSSSLLQSFFLLIMGVFNSMKNIFLDIRDRFAAVIEMIKQKLFNIVAEFLTFFILIKDSLFKTAAVFLNIFFIIVAYGYTFTTFLYSLVQILIIYILILVLVIIILFVIVLLLWYFVFTAHAGTILLKSFVIPTTITLTIKIIILIVITVGISYISDHIKEQDRNCFYEDTLIETKKGLKKIKNIKPGEKLKNNNTVESVIELENKNQECLYKINDVYVTGGHYVYSEEDGWITVENCKKSIKTEFIPDRLCCLITSKKEIIINNTKFSDWDDLENQEIMFFKNTFNITKTEKLNNKINSLLHPNTKIKCKNTTKNIKDIKKGDILADNTRVYGIVKSLPPEIIVKYELNNTEIIGKNIHFDNLGDYMKINHEIFKDNESKHYYHLLTSSHTIKIENATILDYNGCVENILDERLKLE